MSVLSTLLTFCYPLAVHLSIYTGHEIWAADYLGALLALPVLVNIVQRKRPSLCNGVLALCSIVVLVWAEYLAATALKIYPLLMFSTLFILFASSLAVGRTPVANRFAILMSDNVPEAVIRYGRHATIAWSIFFFIMLAVSLYLSLFASLATWSWFTNVFSYLLLVLMFVIEFSVRKRVLREHVNDSFIQFMRNLLAVDYRRLLRE
jgi:uncharacterized membrane protein